MAWGIFDEILRKLRAGKIKNFIPKNSFVCDIGCGLSGDLLKDLLPYIRKGIGFDKKVLSAHSNKIELKSLELEKAIPLPNASIECVTMLAILEHLTYPQAILRECFRILKPGSILILTTPSPSSKPLLEFLAFKMGLISKEEIADHRNYFSKEGLFNMLIDSGFRMEDITIKSFQLGFNIFALAKK